MKIWLSVFILLAASCHFSEANKSTNGESIGARQMDDERIKDERLKAVGDIMEMQRIFFLCNLLMPNDSNFSDEAYKKSPLYSFEQLIPIESNPYVGVLRDPQIFSETYGDRRSELFQMAIRDCHDVFPVEIKRLETNKKNILR